MVRLRIGFGEHIFTVPLSAYGQSVVKLADFGTSAVGAAALGNHSVHTSSSTHYLPNVTSIASNVSYNTTPSLRNHL